MDLAVNYSAAAADLVRSGQIQIDRFKCPAWPELVTSVQAMHPLYVHFPLRVGSGIGDAVDTETKQPADWKKVERLLAQTGTPLVNLHLAPTVEDYPAMPADTTAPADVEMLTEALIRDVRAVVRRLGPENVIVENDYNGFGNLRPACLPATIGCVVEETGCGLLCDLAHASISALDLGMDVSAYIGALPMQAIREIHISGVQHLDARQLDAIRRAGVDVGTLQSLSGRPLDHLPLTGQDWELCTWSMKHIQAGQWGSPWVVASEYGGVGPLWESVTDVDVLAEQMPRLHTLVKGEIL
jgi:uncharacterized protein (UPF0276 family)